MRVPVSCLTCLNDMVFGGVPWRDLDQYLLEVRDDGAYITTCAHGHPISFALQCLRHEILYEAGGVALVCGFHRESISSMATALERFYEFATLVLAEHHGVTPADAATAWKAVAASSERQLGAFHFLYLSSLGKPYSAGSSKMTELRNDVVHKGKIPTREQALSFAEHVYTLIVGVHDELESLDAKALRSVQERLLSIHMTHLQRREDSERPQRGPERMHSYKWHSGTMLRAWANDRTLRDFTWNLEALAFRVKQSNAGLVVYPQTFTKFDPSEHASDEFGSDSDDEYDRAVDEADAVEALAEGDDTSDVGGVDDEPT